MKTKKQIVILDRGWVYIGDVATDDHGIRIDDASCIRRWGTTSGLGEIAKHGPTPQTILEPTGTVRAPWSAVIARIDCEV